jgi:hypothetical protein
MTRREVIQQLLLSGDLDDKIWIAVFDPEEEEEEGEVAYPATFVEGECIGVTIMR